MAWVRKGESPEVIKATFLVSAKEYPELAQFMWSLPYRSASKVLREIISHVVKNSTEDELKAFLNGGIAEKKEGAPSSLSLKKPQKNSKTQDEPVIGKDKKFTSSEVANMKNIESVFNSI